MVLDCSPDPYCTNEMVLRFAYFQLWWPSCSVEHNDFVCVEVLRPSQPNGVMSSTVNLPNHMFTGQA